MKKLITLIALTLLAVSCNRVVETSPKATAQPEPKTVDYFQKKTQCAEHRKKIEDDMASISSAYELPALYQIVYSPTLDTCLAAKYTIYPAHNLVVESEVLSIDDILTGKTIWSGVEKPTLKYWDAQIKLDEQIQLIN